jgi:hypothetical protein
MPSTPSRPDLAGVAFRSDFIVTRRTTFGFFPRYVETQKSWYYWMQLRHCAINRVILFPTARQTAEFHERRRPEELDVDGFEIDTCPVTMQATWCIDRHYLYVEDLGMTPDTERELILAISRHTNVVEEG